MSDIVRKENKAEVKKPEVSKLEYIEFAPPSDVVENHTGIVVLLDVPGATTEKLSVNVEDRILKIGQEGCGAEAWAVAGRACRRRSFTISKATSPRRNRMTNKSRSPFPRAILAISAPDTLRV